MIPFWKDTVTPSLSIVIEGVLYTEQWKDIEGYEGLYQISSFGRVKSFDRYVRCRIGYYLKVGRILKPRWSKKLGYPMVGLSSIKSVVAQKYVHRLVAIAFVDNPNNFSVVNHIDGDKENPFFLNLEWCEQLENSHHAWSSGLQKRPEVERTGKDNSQSVKIAQYTLAGELVKVWDGINEAARAVKGASSKISSVAKGKRETHKGFTWKYVDPDPPSS
jgi:hypothetical protein